MVPVVTTHARGAPPAAQSPPRARCALNPLPAAAVTTTVLRIWNLYDLKMKKMNFEAQVDSSSQNILEVYLPEFCIEELRVAKYSIYRKKK